ncbi:MAG TPA: LLM class flavin-dependent oxidoreductase [Vicinamibacterales bacterium]|nr:LLM class flavin-dependent oxidoreductase [Vicinamibacterales bacterium]
MKFGVFDHIDRAGVPLAQQFEERLRLVEAYDRFGFYAYQLAEHHGTPLGLAPSPGLFLAAAAQRTTRLRLGPLVYSLPLYHPVRLIEEICMLDHLTNGRLELGVGRGVSPIEVGFYGVNPDDGPRQFPEALRVITRGLSSETLTFDGEFYHFHDVPMVLRPVQRPHPPLWYGVVSPETTHWAALERAHIVTLAPTAGAAAVIDRYKAEWTRLGGTGPLPTMGVMRHVVLADSERAAYQTAERAYRRWLGHMRLLWDQNGMEFTLPLPPEIGPMVEAGASYVGTASGFVEFVRTQVEAIGADYVACDVAFGDITFDEAMRTAALVGAQVIPAFRAPAASVL